MTPIFTQDGRTYCARPDVARYIGVDVQTIDLHIPDLPTIKVYFGRRPRRLFDIEGIRALVESQALCFGPRNKIATSPPRQLRPWPRHLRFDI